MTAKHKTFISYHHANDEQYKIAFKKIFADIHDIIVPWDVEVGDIDPNLKTETIRQKIRDEYLKEATVTVVLIGDQTWQRKHVDWEISSSIRDTKNNSRAGLLGILLPNHPNFGGETYNPHIIPPRLYDNIKCGFAQLYDWNTDPYIVQQWIHKAFEDRTKINPDSSRSLFAQNRIGGQWS